MRQILSLLLAAAATSAAAAVPADSVATDTAFVFTDVISVPTTSVKDQNKSGTCWSFAGTSFFEDELLRITGDTLDLS